MDGSPKTRLRLRAVPRAARPGVAGRHGESWKLRVAAAPERGRANEEALDLLAAAPRAPRPSLTLVSRGASRDKIVELSGIPPAETERRLASAGGEETSP